MTVYCTAREEYHACKHPWDYDAHPGDGTDHECHCGKVWVDRRYTYAGRPQIAHAVSPGWAFRIVLGSDPELGPVFSLWIWNRGLHLPLRWFLWWRR